jgi:tetraacyldisaccharide 4'-kinase
MLKSYILDIMEGRRPGRPLLRAMSYLYRAGVALRNKAYDAGMLKARDPGLPVISVGNIIAGGTGKTPFVKFLAEELSRTFKVAIVSRGYYSAVEKTGETLQVTRQTDVLTCGDEPFWLARDLPKVQVWVGKNRFDSAKRAQAQGAQLILMDDGMQHRQLKRDFEIVLIDGEDPFGKGFFLPRGLLRDSPARLKKADCIVVIGSATQDLQEIRQMTDAPIIIAERVIDISLKGKKAAVFCAIGKPQKFLQSVRDAGGEVVASFFKPDHDTFYTQELEKFADESSADVLVCTEKDQVKLSSDLKCRLPIMALKSHLKISGNEIAWQELLNNIQSRVKQ